MILPDINLLVFAYNKDSPFHNAAAKWWTKLVEGHTPIIIPGIVVVGFLRLMTSRVILETPFLVSEAFDVIDEWFTFAHISQLDAGENHLKIYRQIFIDSKGGAKLTTDAYLAALAIEHNCELHSNDSDFSRFPGLKWINPLT